MNEKITCNGQLYRSGLQANCFCGPFLWPASASAAHRNYLCPVKNGSAPPLFSHIWEKTTKRNNFFPIFKEIL